MVEKRNDEVFAEKLEKEMKLAAIFAAESTGAKDNVNKKNAKNAPWLRIYSSPHNYKYCSLAALLA